MNAAFEDETSDQLRQSAELTWNIYRWTCITLDFVAVPICFVCLCIIIFVRKRSDVVLISIPLLFMLSCGFEFVQMFQEGTLYDILVFLDYTTYFMAHWMFCVHYLKTSLILPKICEQANLEWILKDAE